MGKCLDKSHKYLKILKALIKITQIYVKKKINTILRFHFSNRRKTVFFSFTSLPGYQKWKFKSCLICQSTSSTKWEKYKTFNNPENKYYHLCVSKAHFVLWRALYSKNAQRGWGGAEFTQGAKQENKKKKNDIGSFFVYPQTQRVSNNFAFGSLHQE